MIEHDKERFDLDITENTPRIVPRVQKGTKPGQPAWTMLVYAGQIGTSIIVPLLVGVAIGRYADGQFSSHPRGVLIGLGLGFVLSLLSLASTVREIIHKMNT